MSDDAYNTYRFAVYSPYHSALKYIPNNIMMFESRLYIFSIQQPCHNNINVY